MTFMDKGWWNMRGEQFWFLKTHWTFHSYLSTCKASLSRQASTHRIEFRTQAYSNGDKITFLSTNVLLSSPQFSYIWFLIVFFFFPIMEKLNKVSTHTHLASREAFSWKLSDRMRALTVISNQSWWQNKKSSCSAHAAVFVLNLS